MKLLLIRMDRLGDLVCTLPVDQHPRVVEKKYSIQWLISKGLEPILDCSRPKRSFWSESLTFTWRRFFNLIAQLKSENFDQVVLFYAPWWIAAACFFAGIKLRSSPRSRWFQFLFFNHTLRQSRSRSDKHEADYNWDLFHWALTGDKESIEKPPYLVLESASDLPLELKQPYVVIHPGMAGSALNWPMTQYLDLAKTLTLELGKQVVITGTSGDLPWLNAIETPLKELQGVHWMVGKLDLPTLIKVLSRSEATIAPSTGVIHLAASTGVKTIGLYSPIRVQTPIRWGPRGPRAIALMPNVNCPASTKCLGQSCNQYFCLNQISVEKVLEAIK